jgi:hypothetical protein
MRDPLTWSKKVRLRRWVLKELAREQAALAAAAGVPARCRQCTIHAARASALVRIFGVTGQARDEVAALVLEQPIDPITWDAAYESMRREIAAVLVALGLPVRSRGDALGAARR